MKPRKAFKHHTELLEVQNSLVAKHDKLMKEMVTHAILDAKLDVIISEIEKRTENKLQRFSKDLYDSLNDKIDKPLFNTMLNDKVPMKDLLKTNDTLTNFWEKLDFLNSIIENIQTSTKADLYSFDLKINQFKDFKAESKFVEELKERIEKLEKDVKEMNGEDEEDEYDEVDSIEEDVLSLNRDNNFESSVSNSNFEKEQNKNQENHDSNEDNDDFFNSSSNVLTKSLDKNKNNKEKNDLI